MDYFPSNSFYGKIKKSKWLHQASARAATFVEHPIPDVPKSNILGNSQIWKHFYKQNFALEYAKSTGLGLMTFAFEGKGVGENGIRNFVVCHPKYFWKVFQRRSLHSRCSYEVIPEGYPCKLYFDLEFFKELNPNCCGEILTEIFVKIVNYFINKEFGISYTIENILFLDSSTDLKFSNHIIYGPSLIFKSNFDAGNFVKMVCSKVKGYRKDLIPSDMHVTSSEIEKLFVYTGKDWTIFCDESVYTKNRNFRTYKSTKYGKLTPLQISKQNKYKSSLGAQDYYYFLDSLITYVKESTAEPVVFCPDEIDFCENKKLRENANIQNFQTSSSPYPKIEDYINGYLGDGQLIKSWQYFDKSDILVFNIDKKYRFCHNIGREHKSNGIIIVVNISKGVFYQKCHDYDCRNFKSNEVPLPPGLVQSKNVNSVDDEELIDAADEAEILYIADMYENR